MGTQSLKDIRKEYQSKGQFYTPDKLARYMAQFLEEDLSKIKEVYDPTCGGGNLLRIFPDEVKKYGQELDSEALDYCKNNLVNFEGYCGDLLTDPNPAWVDRKFEYIMANYPFSIKWEGKDNPKFLEDERFKGPEVLAPKGKSDFAFILHCLHYLSDTGKAVVMGFPGVAYRGQAEYKIRKWFIEQNVIETVLDLPSNSFEDTTIATIVFVLNKHKTTTDIKFISYEFGIDRVVKLEEVIKEDYNLSVSTYIQPPKTEKEYIDVRALHYQLERDGLTQLKLCLDRALKIYDTFTNSPEGYNDLKNYIGAMKELLEVYDKEIEETLTVTPNIDLNDLFERYDIGVTYNGN